MYLFCIAPLLFMLSHTWKSHFNLRLKYPVYSYSPAQHLDLYNKEENEAYIWVITVSALCQQYFILIL